MWRSPLAALALAIVISACGQMAHSHPPPRKTATTTGTVTQAAVPPHRAHHHRRPNPGRLPQTDRRPSASSRGFHKEMAALWRGLTGGQLKPALPAFFPEGAYVQIKAIADPQADYHARLLGAFQADISAAHALLGAGARSARLIAVRVPAGYAHWVPPGTCYNRVGYWETPNSRIVYRENGQVRSFGIASLISWRGVWYVVHLGAVLRIGTGGMVDDPSPGPGYSAPSSTC